MLKKIPQSDPSWIMRMAAERSGTKIVTIDKGVSMEAFTREAALTHRLHLQYGVRFLPKQVIRRELSKGLNPFKS